MTLWKSQYFLVQKAHCTLQSTSVYIKINDKLNNIVFVDNTMCVFYSPHTIYNNLEPVYY